MIVNRVKELRTAAGMTQKALVDQLGGDSAFIKERFLYRALKEYND